MRIGFYLNETQIETIGGGFTYQQCILEELLRINNKHEIYIYYKHRQKVYEDTNNIKFINLRFEKRPFFRQNILNKNRCFLSLNELTLRDKIDLMYFMPYMYEDIDIPYVSILWDVDHKQTPFFPEVSSNGMYKRRDSFCKKSLEKASFIVIGNNEGKKQLCKYYSINENLVITNPMATPDYIYNLEEDNSILKEYDLVSHKFLFYPAQFWAHKNHIRLVKAAKILKESGSDLKIVFTGSNQGNLEYIKEKVKEFGVEKEVIFCGFVDRPKLISLYKNAFALAFVSFMGPDNIPPLEAMGLGCPVISSGTAGMMEQLRDSALFFNPTSEEDLIEQINKLYDENIRNDLICKGYKLAQEYNISNYVKKLLSIADDFKPIRECWDF